MSPPFSSTPLEDHQHAEARRASVSRVLSIWGSLERRYARAIDDDDIIDLRNGTLVQDRGVLKARSKPWHYGQMLQGAGDAEGETNDDDDDDEEDEDERDGITASEDELGEWATMPAPSSASPSPNGSPNASRATSPGPALQSESRRPTTLPTFLHADFLPKLEKLAKEREDSPLPPADLEAFMAAEQSLKARTKPGHLETETPSDDDDEIVRLGYETGQEDAATSGVDERGAVGRHEDSEDELDDWDTVPAPPSDEETPEELLGFAITLSPLAPSNTMPSIDRRGSDTSALSSSAPLSNSSTVLAKARAALSSSLATTSSFTTQSGRAGRR